MRTLHVCDTYRVARTVFDRLPRPRGSSGSFAKMEALHEDGSIERVVVISRIGEGLDRLRGSQWDDIRYHGQGYPEHVFRQIEMARTR